MEWLAENLGTILISMGLAAVVAAVLRKLIRDRRQGKSACACGSGCAHCPMHGSCHKA